MRTRDFSAWKKDWDVCMRALVLASRGVGKEGHSLGGGGRREGMLERHHRRGRKR